MAQEDVFKKLFHTVKSMVSYFPQVKFTMDWELYTITVRWVWN